ncbi:MAG: DUF3343 domain-containing protein [Bacillota bacterium]|nr:DUF3343 domain-containing protein [Bacillota bacterium]
MQKNKYLVLFFTQYGAINYSKLLKKEGIENLTKPVPRALSSSCGICVETDTEKNILDYLTEDVEAVYRLDGESYQLLYEEE